MQEIFTECMHRHWTQTLGLASSAALIDGWAQLERAVVQNEAEAAHFQVVQLPTGSGKTEAIKMLCSIQTPPNHPGVLIVTRLTEEADRIAEGINELSGSMMARPIHSNSPQTATDPRFSPVLVITHSAYRQALQDIAGTGASTRWDMLKTYEGGLRKWLIIDEAVDWADTYNLNLGDLRGMSGDLAGALPPHLRGLGTQLLDLAVDMTDQQIQPDRIMKQEQWNILCNLDISSLHDAVANVPDAGFADWLATAEPSCSERKISTKQGYLCLLQQLRTIVQIGHGWISRRGGMTALHSSRSLLGLGGIKGIILDATASLDPAYSLIRSEAKLLPQPHGIRNYRNATLHASYGHRVGKVYLTECAGQEWTVIWEGLRKRLSGRNVLVCAHKDVIPHIRQYGLTDGTVEFAHWGNLDGKNDWSSCDALVIFGFPYIDDIVPAQTFIAHKGPQSDDWFAGARKYEGQPDIRRALGDGFVARSIVQALNRTQCRKPIDAQGNCPHTDLYLMLPNGRTGSCVLRAITQQMPGIVIREWTASAAKRKARKLPTEAKLTAHFERAAPGTYPKSVIVRELGIHASSLERSTARLRIGSSELARTFAELGVHYCSQTGRGKEAYFIKQ